MLDSQSAAHSKGETKPARETSPPSLSGFRDIFRSPQVPPRIPHRLEPPVAMAPPDLVRPCGPVPLPWASGPIPSSLDRGSRPSSRPCQSLRETVIQWHFFKGTCLLPAGSSASSVFKLQFPSFGSTCWQVSWMCMDITSLAETGSVRCQHSPNSTYRSAVVAGAVAPGQGRVGASGPAVGGETSRFLDQGDSRGRIGVSGPSGGSHRNKSGRPASVRPVMTRGVLH